MVALRDALVAVALTAAVAGGAGCFGAPGWEGPASPHFDGSRFHNVPPDDPPGLLGTLAWKWNPDDIAWCEAPAVVPVVPAARVDHGIRVTFVNHATALVQMDGVNLLTDPVWSDLVGPLSWVGIGRKASPGVRLEDLPRIDAVLLSHSHYDHSDAPTLAALEARFAAPTYGGLGSRDMLAEHDVRRGVDLDWWQSTSLAGRLTVTFIPARHWSQRGICDRNQVLWGGFVVQGPSGTVLFAGDTGFGDHFAEVRRRFGAVDLALLPIGAFHPRSHLGSRHMAPEDAVRAHLVLGARRSLGIHWGTFDLADEGRYQPAGELGLALDAAGVPRGDFVALANGGVLEVPAP